MNFVYNPGEIVSCHGCNADIRGLQRRCKGCKKSILCYVCWSRSGVGCKCNIVDVKEERNTCCTDCSKETESFGTLAESVFTTTAAAVETVCMDYVVEPVVGVTSLSVALSFGLVAAAFDVVIAPVHLVYKEFA
jgi:hypothetical protein